MSDTMKYGYARVSGSAQELEPQCSEIKKAGVDPANIYADTSALITDERPQFAKCMDALTPGDTLIIWQLDRLGRSIQEIIEIVRKLTNQKITLISLSDKLDTSTPEGQLFFNAAGALIEYDSNLNKERAIAGLKEAKNKGIRGGRRYKLTKDQQDMLLENHNQGVPMDEILTTFGIGKSAYYEYLKALKEGKYKE